MKKCVLVFFIYFLVIAIGNGYSQDAPIITLDSLIDEALNKNPEIQATYYGWQQGAYKIKQASSLSDPVASYTRFGENVETRLGPQEAKYGLSQKILFPGKLNLKAKAQSKQADILQEKYEATKRNVIKNIKFVYYDIFWVDKAIQITEQEKAILESLEKVVQKKYQSNLAPQQDVVKVQVELSKLIDKLFLLKQNRKSLVAKMNSLVNRTKGTKLGSVSNIKPEDFKYNLEQLHAKARDSSQQLEAASLDIERAKYEKSLARLDYLPDFTFGVDYIEIGGGHTTSPNDGQDAWMGRVSVNIPIWFDKLGSQVKEKEAKLKETKKNYENIENSISYEIEDLYFKIVTYQDIILLYDTALIPQTELSFYAAKIAYETGKVDFLNWLDAERVLLQTNLAYYKAIADYLKSIAYLEMVVGTKL
ncbi:MAG: TolC family protein [Candidatus Omnitrophota bacterium]